VPLQYGQTTTTRVEHDAGVVSELGLGCRAQQAVALESPEAGFLFEDRSGDERHAEQLRVRMGERGAGLAPVVHDRLRVPDDWMRRVLLHAVTDRAHHERCGAVVEVSERLGVLG
jgi:hypothetical protein